MTIDAYREEIKLNLTGYLLDLEIDDPTIDNIILVSMREIQRYMDSTKLLTIPYTGSCIKLGDLKINSISRVFRTVGYTGNQTIEGTSQVDPMYVGMLQMLSGNGNLYNINDWTYNYAAFNAGLQIRNTLSTDLLFRYQRDTNEVYINTSFDSPALITIEYVPRFDDVDDIKSDYWIDQLTKLATARTKQIIGRIRTRFQQSNALWSQDGDTLLNEANAELTQIRADLKASTQLVYPID